MYDRGIVERGVKTGGGGGGGFSAVIEGEKKITKQIGCV